MKKEKVKLIIIILILVITDQVTKFLISINHENFPITVFQNILKLSYIQNFGIAFGLAKNSRIFFITINFIIIGMILKFLFTQCRNLNSIKKVCLAIIAAGGIGNLVDRVFRGYVVDFIDISAIINYPVFNFADILICMGIICFSIYLIKDIINEKNIKL